MSPTAMALYSRVGKAHKQADEIAERERFFTELEFPEIYFIPAERWVTRAV